MAILLLCAIALLQLTIFKTFKRTTQLQYQYQRRIFPREADDFLNYPCHLQKQEKLESWF